MTVVAFALGSNVYAVYYHYHFDDILADLVQFSIVFDPFRSNEIVVIDLSRLG